MRTPAASAGCGGWEAADGGGSGKIEEGGREVGGGEGEGREGRAKLGAGAGRLGNQILCSWAS